MGIGNQIKTVVLLGALSALLLGIGSFWGYSGLLIGLIFALIMNVGSYFYSDKLVLKMYKAKEVSKKTHPELFKIIQELSLKANIPMPKVYIIPSNNPNAFATGRNPKHSAVAFTEGILQELNNNELKGVAAHELGHIKNRDILIATIAATIAAVISYAAMMARFAAIFGGFGRDRDGGNMFELLALAILTPIIATIIQLAISRSREYIEDAESANLTGNPKYLADALRKISSASKRNPMKIGNNSTASLFIANPFSGKGFVKLFSTHPPIEERIKKLEQL